MVMIRGYLYRYYSRKTAVNDLIACLSGRAYTKLLADTARSVFMVSRLLLPNTVASYSSQHAETTGFVKVKYLPYTSMIFDSPS